MEKEEEEEEKEEREEEEKEGDVVEKYVLEKNDMDMDTSGSGDEQTESALEVSGKLNVERNDRQVKVDVAKEEVFVREKVVEKMFTRSSANTLKHEKDMVSTSTADPEALRKKRTFRKFAYRGVDLDQLLDLSVTQVIIFSFIKCLSQEFSLTRVLARPVLFSLQVSTYLSRLNA